MFEKMIHLDKRLEERGEMGYFSEKFFSFFEELSLNNNKDWFHAHKKTYEDFIKKPFEQLVEELIDMIREEEPDLDIEPKDAIFRINRDIRFSKDKTPYKTHVGASIKKGGKKSPNSPGFYIHLSSDSAMVGGGVYGLETKDLYRIRKHIAQSLNEFSKVLEDKNFRKKYGSLKGEKNQRIPKEFQEALKKQPLIANKHFLYTTKLDPEIILEPDLPDQLMDYYRAGKHINDFFQTALRS